MNHATADVSPLHDVGEIELSLPDGSQDLSQGSIRFIGTATVLMRYAGFTILTDPNFLHRGESVHLGYGLRSKRLTEPAMTLDDLPPIDLVVLSHLHEDHFDRKVQERLERAVPIVTTPKAAHALSHMGFRKTIPLQTWQGVSFVKGGTRLRITGMPGRHGPWLLSNLLPPVMGSMLEFQKGEGELLLRSYITGDTLMHGALRDIPARYPHIDQALLHLGGTRVVGMLVTMDAKQGVQALQLFKPKIAIPIHYNDYTVFKSPLADFRREVKAAGLDLQVRYVDHGETYSFLLESRHEKPVERERWR
ncbi:MAG TPA: MBL fold metallo-hydrolase [Nitrospiraceae bacterium]|nr:MBL fold metallo-hydrolase [Nitrospiraceae bacterium]